MAAKLSMEYVSAVAGAAKTDRAIQFAIRAAASGSKIVIALPTLHLIREKVERADHFKAKLGLTDVWLDRIDSGVVAYGAVIDGIRTFFTGTDEERAKARMFVPKGQGLVMFVTHAALFAMTDWDFAGGIDLIIDEVPDITRSHSLNLIDHAALIQRLFIADEALIPQAKQSEMERLTRQIAKVTALKQRPGTPGEGAAAEHRLAALRTKMAALTVTDYYRLRLRLEMANDVVNWKGEYYEEQSLHIRRLLNFRDRDDVYKIFADLVQEARSYTFHVGRDSWDALIRDTRFAGEKVRHRGSIVCSGILTPDFLRPFKSVTFLSALFEYSLLYKLWETAGVEWRPSSRINVKGSRTALFNRRLYIYYVMGEDERWSKQARDHRLEGGLDGLRDALNRVFGESPVCVVVNNDVDDETWSTLVKHPIKMPNVSHGSNRWFEYHNVIYLSALNATPRDISFIEQIGGVSGEDQTLARSACSAYQALMRASLRNPKSTADVRLVVGDRAVATFVARWFQPADQVIVTPLALASGGVRKRRGATSSGGRAPTYTDEGGGPRAGSAAERKRRERARKRALGVP